MCGITGIIPLRTTVSASREWLALLTGQIAHRGPDGEGCYFDGHVGLGHRLLSITGVKDGSIQPLHTDEDLVLVYNGELYNFPELKTQLREQGFAFRTGTDTEVLYRAYQAYGPDCNHRFNGMWAYALYDRQKQQVILSRDRFGIKPLYYTVYRDCLIFCSEIKQLKNLPGFSFLPNKRTIAQFVVGGKLNYCDETLFGEIQEVPPGCNLVIDMESGQYRVTRWYEFAVQEELAALSYQEAKQHLADLFGDIIKDHIPVEVPFGAFASGGMDSSAIIDRLVAEGRPFSALSFCFEHPDYNEEEYADTLAAAYKIDLVKVKPDLSSLFLPLLEECTAIQDQPVTGFSHALEYLLFRMAANEGRKVMFDGQGADEIWAGYSPFRSLYDRQQLSTGRIGLLGHNNPYASQVRHMVHALLFRYPSQRRHPLVSMLKPLRTRRWLRPEAYRHECYKVPVADISSTATLSQYLLQYELPYLLHSLDHNAMACSIEARVPFLDHRLVEMALSLPDHFKIDALEQKKILRDVFRHRLPQQIVDRKRKMGFVAPDEALMSHPGIRSQVLHQLEELCERMPGIFDRRMMADYDTALRKGGAASFFRVLSLACWARNFGITCK